MEPIARESGWARANTVLDELEHSFVLLAGNPRCGHRRQDLAPRDQTLLFWPVYAYLVVYLPDTRPLFIARILHGARDPEELRTELGGREDDG